jgi:hypothetical protein
MKIIIENMDMLNFDIICDRYVLSEDMFLKCENKINWKKNVLGIPQFLFEKYYELIGGNYTGYFYTENFDLLKKIFSKKIHMNFKLVTNYETFLKMLTSKMMYTDMSNIFLNSGECYDEINGKDFSLFPDMMSISKNFVYGEKFLDYFFENNNDKKIIECLEKLKLSETFLNKHIKYIVKNQFLDILIMHQNMSEEFIEKITKMPECTYKYIEIIFNYQKNLSYHFIKKFTVNWNASSLLYHNIPEENKINILKNNHVTLNKYKFKYTENILKNIFPKCIEYFDYIFDTNKFKKSEILLINELVGSEFLDKKKYYDTIISTQNDIPEKIFKEMFNFLKNADEKTKQIFSKKIRRNNNLHLGKIPNIKKFRDISILY